MNGEKVKKGMAAYMETIEEEKSTSSDDEESESSSESAKEPAPPILKDLTTDQQMKIKAEQERRAKLSSNMRFKKSLSLKVAVNDVEVILEQKNEESKSIHEEIEL